MKKILFFIIVIWSFCACSDDSNDFTVDLPNDAFCFTPSMGGAILKYLLPDDPEVIAIQVRYNDEYGNPIIKSGSNSTNLLELTGFNEAKQDIPAEISYLKRNNEESQSIHVTFSTLDSGPITFIKNVEVKSGWNGCSLSYDNPEGTKGMAHVFYLGINPLNNNPDTILLESFPLTVGQDVRNYSPKQKNNYNTIIVRVEDYRGYIVKEKSWSKIQSFEVEKLDPSKFDIVYNNALEVPEEKIGLQYLTDGDTKGTAWFKEQNKYCYYTFISKENGAGEDSEPMYIDLKKMRPTAEIRFYAYRHVGNNKIAWSSGNSSYIGCQYFKNSLSNKLPCSVTIYGCRENTDSNLENVDWEELGSFEEDPNISLRDRWTFGAATCGGTTFGKNTYTTFEKMEAAEPIYKAIYIDIDKQKDGFRWLKIKFNQVFNLQSESPNMTNKQTRYLSFHELEVYSNKD